MVEMKKRESWVCYLWMGGHEVEWSSWGDDDLRKISTMTLLYQFCTVTHCEDLSILLVSITKDLLETSSSSSNCPVHETGPVSMLSQFCFSKDNATYTSLFCYPYPSLFLKSSNSVLQIDFITNHLLKVIHMTLYEWNKNKIIFL